MDTAALRREFEERADAHLRTYPDDFSWIPVLRRYFERREWLPVLDIMCAEMFDWDASIGELCNGYDFKISTLRRLPRAHPYDTLYMEYNVYESTPELAARFAEVVQRTITVLTDAGYDASLVGYSTSKEDDGRRRQHEWLIAVHCPTEPE